MSEPAPRSTAAAVVFASVWAALGAVGFGVAAFYLFIIMMEVRWTTLTYALLWGAGPLLALGGGVPAALLFRRGKPMWQVALAVVAALASYPVLFALILMSTVRVR
jgi:hypothetical protein